MSTARNALTAEPTNGSGHDPRPDGRQRHRQGDPAIFGRSRRYFHRDAAKLTPWRCQPRRRNHRAGWRHHPRYSHRRWRRDRRSCGTADLRREAAGRPASPRRRTPPGSAFSPSRAGAASCAGASPARIRAPAAASCSSPLTFLAAMQRMSSRTTAPPGPHGTAVTFEPSEAPHAVRAFLETAARHYPLPVTIDGETVIERRAFLDGALHVEPWKGLVFGVFKDRHAGYRVPDVNFHGPDPAGAPAPESTRWKAASGRRGPTSTPAPIWSWYCRRGKEAVETLFLEEMREAARLAVLPRHGAGRSGPAGCLDRRAQGGRSRDRDARAARRAALPGVPPSPTPTIGTSGPPSQA